MKIAKKAVAEIAILELILFYVIINIIMTPTNLSLGAYGNFEYLTLFMFICIPIAVLWIECKGRIA